MASGDQAANRGGSCPTEPIASNSAAVAQYTIAISQLKYKAEEESC